MPRAGPFLSGEEGVPQTFLFRCPTTGLRVQGWVAEDVPEDNGDTYEGIACLACRATHLVNPRTGKVAGEEPQQ